MNTPFIRTATQRPALQRLPNHGLMRCRRPIPPQLRALTSAPAFSSRAPRYKRSSSKVQHDETVHIEHPVATFAQLGIGRKTKIFLFAVLGVFGTMETWFWCETIYRWWKGDAKER